MSLDHAPINETGNSLLRQRANPVDVHVGRRVRVLRVARSMSQEKLAERLGVTFQQVQKYEKGINRISASRLHAIAAVLGVSVQKLFDGLTSSEADAPDALADLADIVARCDLEMLRVYADLPRDQRTALLTIAKAMGDRHG